MKKLVLLYVVAIFAVAGASAQDARDFRAEYEAFRQNARSRYDSFRDSCNVAYARFMREAWEKFTAEEPIAVPQKPKPETPPVYEPEPEPEPEPAPAPEPTPEPTPTPTPDPEPEPTPEPTPEPEPAPEPEPDPEPAPAPAPVPIDVVVTPPAPAPRPEPVEPIEPAPPGVKNPFAFTFYNTQCSVDLDPRARFKLNGVTENSVADAWEKFGKFDATVASCLALRDRLALCDWAYVQMTGEVARRFFGGNLPDEATLLQAYILLQSGYKIRLARAGERLAMLLGCSDLIYAYSYFTFDGERFYIVDKSASGRDFYVFNMKFPGERASSMRLASLPRFTPKVASGGTFASKRYPDLKANVRVDRSLLDFYTDYPSVRWNYYSGAGLSAATRESLYPALRSAIAGKSNRDAANILINFVQTAFNYSVDQEQFGRERTLFGDELFHYPASDCEDRSVLYSTLVRELLGLDVVLLDYPGHIATAVCFGAEAYGDHFIYEGRKYTICDPTYIGADIGQCMPDYKRTSPGVIVIE